jgi:hypothetical protein
MDALLCGLDIGVKPISVDVLGAFQDGLEDKKHVGNEHAVRDHDDVVLETRALYPGAEVIDSIRDGGDAEVHSEVWINVLLELLRLVKHDLLDLALEALLLGRLITGNELLDERRCGPLAVDWEDECVCQAKSGPPRY